MQDHLVQLAARNMVVTRKISGGTRSGCGSARRMALASLS